MSEPIFAKGFILDKSSVLTLYASGYMQTILEHLSSPVMIPDFLLRQSLYILGVSVNNVVHSTEHVDIQTFIKSGLLLLISLNNEVEEKAANLARLAYIGDAEAITVILAMQYEWVLVTDNHQYIPTLLRMFQGMQIISTRDVIHDWIERTKPPLSVIKRIVQNLEERAVYKL